MNLAKTYTPNEYEPMIYAMWEKSGVFGPKGEGTPYAVVLPPPNANGNLHVGHALSFGLEDILVRFHRMKGYDSVLLPGSDHAGFETWVVYERELEKIGKSRFDFTREQLYDQVWDYVDKKRGDMELQLRALGIGPSWKDYTFSLDKKVVDVVYSTFKKMWDDNLIYRGERMINFCTAHQTGFSDIEVVHKDEKSKLWNIAYPFVDREGELIIATTRPETLFGDVALAVNPNDDRYKDIVGQKVKLPLTDREIPVIADEYVDMKYGTGVVKITPAHDPNDFEVGMRHNLERIHVIGFDGKMVDVPSEYVGMTTIEARKKVLSALKDEGLRRGEEDIIHSVAHCYKCDSIIEPMVKKQWFIHTEKLAKPAIEAIKANSIRFIPDNRGKLLIDYLENIRDWNISRQIPWGIPIPAFQNENNPDDWIYDERVDEKEIVVDGVTYIRDEDVFDTWFSSGQWPYITTEALKDSDLARFYPTAVMETGYDILYAWVSRMIMLGLYRTGKVPFKDVYLHGMVNDEHNQKMSKSKGNVVSPIEYVTEFGSDALRMGIIASRSAAQSQAFSKGKVIAGRNFCNKLWNVARFVESMVGDIEVEPTPEPVSLADHWIIERLNHASQLVSEQLADYRFSEAAEVVYHTLWDDVADWYIEVAKVEKNVSMAAYVLDTILKIAHPFAPFVTETIWQAINWHDTLLAGESWPEQKEFHEITAGEFGRLKRLVTEVRYVMSELPGNERYRLLYVDDTLAEDNADLILKLTRAKSMEKVDQPRGLRLASSGRDVWLDLDADTIYEHQTNLEKRLAEARNVVKVLENRLANEEYVAKAPAELVEDSRKQLISKQALVQRLANELEVLSDN